MARRPPAAPQDPALTLDQMKRAIPRLQARIAELEAFAPESVSRRWSPEVKAIKASIEGTLEVAFGHGTVKYNRYERAAELDHGPLIAGRQASIQEVRKYLEDGKQQAIVLLRQAIRGIEEEIRDQEIVEVLVPVQPQAERDPSKVFLVHGHDGEVREAVARFISERLGLEPVILHERPNKGRTIITKFREEAAGISFAVVLMTADDLGKASAAPDLQPRARQNVVFELGFFIGALGPEHVAAIVKGTIERPSDFDGVVYISFDQEDW